MRNLFIIHSPFQKFVAELLVASDPAFAGHDNHLLVETDHPACQTAAPGLWTAIHKLEALGYSVLSRASHLAAERNLRRVRELAAEGPVRILLSDIAWPFNNRVFFDRKLSRVAEFHFIIDGIGSYTGTRFTTTLRIRNLGKFVLGRLGLAVRYTPYGGYVMGDYHPRVRQVHGFAAHLLSCPPEKQAEIPFEPPAALQSEDTCLFLDQSYWQICPEAEWLAFREQTKDYLLSLGCGTYYYKRHPQGRTEDEEYYARAGFRIIEDGRCVEELFHDLGASLVVSYNSSALFNIKVFYGDRTRCISYCSDYVTRLTHSDSSGMQRLKELFQGVGVEVVDTPAPVAARV
ncbi:MAG TPA: polysialyltransferase family glycosyltransferase [Stenomitos sp.]